MENKRAILISIVCFMISLLLINAYVKLKTRELTRDFGQEVPVVVAAAPIPEYGIIRPEMLEVRMVFKKFQQAQTVSDPADIIGKAAYVPLYEGEQITLGKLIYQDGKPVLDRQVEKKMRAVTLNISPHTGVGRLVRPGNRIDVIATVNYEQNGATNFEIKTLVQNVLVLATGKNLNNTVPSRVNRDVLNLLEADFEQRKRKDFYSASTANLPTSRPDDEYSHITLQLTPDEAEKILYISHNFGDARLYFTLRNSSDRNPVNVASTILDDVLGPDSDYGDAKRKPPPVVPAQPKYIDDVGGQQVPVF